jgi:hypothetical protein
MRADRSMRVNENRCSAGLSCNLDFRQRRRRADFFVGLRALRRVVDRSASRAAGPLRQHFLKLDAVFFDVLVYSD